MTGERQGHSRSPLWTTGILVLAMAIALSTHPVMPQQSYILGPEDIIEVFVYGNEDISRIVAIRPDGMISLPLVGEVRAAGFTPEQLRQRLTDLFAPYIKNPQVAVIVREFRRLRVTVLGQVMRPGVYELRQGSRVLDALAAAGGLTEAAGLGEVKLVREPTQLIIIDLERLLLRGEVALNWRLEPGDSLIIPEDLTSRVYVLGEVTKPGLFPLRGTLTALQALSLAGGPTRRALLSRSYIIRRTDAPKEAGTSTIQLATVVLVRQDSPAVRIIPIDFLKIIREGDVMRDVPLNRGDILYVPENPMAVENILIILGGLSTLRDLLR